jgi:hypothetical protein
MTQPRYQLQHAVGALPASRAHLDHQLIRAAGIRDLVGRRVLCEHGVKQDGVGEIDDADVVLERDLQLSGIGAGRLCLREGGE